MQRSSRIRLAMLPPDERPNTGGYAKSIARCSGADVLLPPEEVMPHFRRPADTSGLAQWLRRVDGSVDAHIISLDLLVHGGLVPSRLTNDLIGEAIPRLDVLRELRAPVYAYQVITRLPHYDNPTRSRQEPKYWETHGRAMFELSQAWDRREYGEARAQEVTTAKAAIPSEFVTDQVRRRMRNHAVNLAALELATAGILTELIITSDDTALRGLPAADRRSIDRWLHRLGQGFRVYPGADEVPSVLVPKVLGKLRGIIPKIYVDCPNPLSLTRIAPYEDQPADLGISAQISALGGVRVETPENADLVLMVHGPAEEPGDWVEGPIYQDSSTECLALASAAITHLAADREIAVADIRYANGSDPTLVTALNSAGILEKLAAYGGWNTASNTLGTTLAAGVSVVFDDSTYAAAARRDFRDLKILKDAHYLPVQRLRMQTQYSERGIFDPPVGEMPALARRVEEELNEWAANIRALDGVRVENLDWPWDYLFTVDFDITRR